LSPATKKLNFPPQHYFLVKHKHFSFFAMHVAFIVIVSAVMFRRKGLPKRAPAKPRGNHLSKKKRRVEKDRSWEGTNRVDATTRESEPKLSERASMGLLQIDEEQMRSYVIGVYAIRFHEPTEDLWSGIIGALLGEHIPMTARTIREIFKNCQNGDTSCKRKPGGGRKRILNPDNEGLAAGILALNGGVSPALATEVCNQHNERRNSAVLDLTHKDMTMVT
jgi:hypothetical protein